MKKSNFIFIVLGIGIGIILTSIIFYFNPLIKYKEYTDEQIIKKAEELGMVFIKDNIDSEHEEIKPKEKDFDKKAKSKKKNSVIKVEISAGDSSIDVAEKLLDLGIIEDKVEFVQFLMDKNMDKKLRPGTYELKPNLSYSTILKILSKNK